MADATEDPIVRSRWRTVLAASAAGWRVVRRRGPAPIAFWFVALLVGIAAGFAAIGFRAGVEALQGLLYGTEEPAYLRTFAAGLPWWWIVVLPALGGLVVGAILHRFTPDGRVRSVAEVIEGSAMADGRVEGRAGLASAAASFVTLSSGGSSGREGPVVHLAAVIASWVSDRIRADGITGRDLLGCAVAAAVSASFNAPIAGALFALEVVLRHFAVHAFAPIVVASAAGAVITHSTYGNVTEFVPQETALAFYVELPAFLLLGLLCGLVATVLMRAIFWADDAGTELQELMRMPRWLRPGAAGLLVGGIAVFFPHVIGVGYETTSDALTGQLLFHEAMVFCMVKVAAVAITMGGRMGGGVFSPSLMVGALTGLAFGILATSLFPEVSGLPSLYALAGMGAVAAAVLGAPISTTLIVFELTGDWQTGLAVMVSVSMSTALASRLVERSFFLTQLERRGVHLAAGPQAWLLSKLRVGRIMRGLDHPDAAPPEACERLLAEGLSVRRGDPLERAMPLFDRAGTFLPVVDREGALIGSLFRIDALVTYNRALAATTAEEHS
jgi:CIC family chloride channel protein